VKKRRLLAVLAVLVSVSVVSTSIIADEKSECEPIDGGSSSQTQIDEDLNQSILRYLEDLDEEDIDPDTNVDTSEHLSDEEILRAGYLEELERYQISTPKDGWKDLYDTVDPPRTDPTGFYSIGSDIYYTDPSTGVRYCNTTLTYEHIVFTFGSDYKVTSFAAQSGYESRRRVKILLEAFSHIGTPYALSAEPPTTFACGSFVQYVYLTALGVRQRAASDKHVQDFDNGICEYDNQSISLDVETLNYESDMLPGDIICWYSPDCAANHANCPFLTNCEHYKGVHHTAIYIGNGQVIEAVSNNTLNCVIVGDIRQMNGLSIYGYVRLINETVSLPNVTGLTASPAGEHKVSLEWSSNRYADGYLIYSRKNDVYSYCGMTTIKYNDGNNNYTSRFVDAAALSTTNDYYVFPYVTDYSGTVYPGAVSVMVTAAGICPAVTNLILFPQNGSIRLAWDPSPEAEGYLIYGYTEGGSYGYFGMTTILTNPGFTHLSASAVYTNHYWVFPYYIDDVTNQMIIGEISEEVYGLAL